MKKLISPMIIVLFFFTNSFASTTKVQEIEKSLLPKIVNSQNDEEAFEKSNQIDENLEFDENNSLLPCCMIASTTVLDYNTGTAYTFYGSYCEPSGNCTVAYITASQYAYAAKEEFVKGIEK